MAAVLALALVGCAEPAPPRLLRSLRCGLGAQALALAPDGAVLAVSCQRSNDVWLIRLDDGSSRRFDTSPQPGALVFHPGGAWLLVAEPSLGSVAQVALADLRVGRRWSAGWPPGLLAVDGGGQRLLAGQAAGDELALLRLKELRLEKSVRLGGRVLAVDAPEGEDWLALTEGGDSLAKVSAKDLNPSAALLPGPSPAGLSVHSGDGLALVACRGIGEEGRGGGVAVVRLKDFRRTDLIEVEGSPLAVALAPSGRRAVVLCSQGSFKLLDLASGKVVQVLALPGRPSAMLATHKGRRYLVALRDRREVLEIELGSLR